MSSLRETIFAADDIQSESVEIPEWGVTVEVRTMTAADRTTLQTNSTSADGKVDMTKFMPSVVIATVHDPETGLPVFQASDVPALLSKSGVIIERLAQKALQISGMEASSADNAGATFPASS
jgi:hypothetical protein